MLQAHDPHTATPPAHPTSSPRRPCLAHLVAVGRVDEALALLAAHDAFVQPQGQAGSSALVAQGASLQQVRCAGRCSQGAGVWAGAAVGGTSYTGVSNAGGPAWAGTHLLLLRLFRRPRPRRHMPLPPPSPPAPVPPVLQTELLDALYCVLRQMPHFRRAYTHAAAPAAGGGAAGREFDNMAQLLAYRCAHQNDSLACCALCGTGCKEAQDPQGSGAW